MTNNVRPKYTAGVKLRKIIFKTHQRRAVDIISLQIDCIWVDNRLQLTWPCCWKYKRIGNNIFKSPWCSSVEGVHRFSIALFLNIIYVVHHDFTIVAIPSINVINWNTTLITQPKINGSRRCEWRKESRNKIPMRASETNLSIQTGRNQKRRSCHKFSFASSIYHVHANMEFNNKIFSRVCETDEARIRQRD